MAAALLWVLDASINISIEPFRAFVADNLAEEQRATGSPCRAFHSRGCGHRRLVALVIETRVRSYQRPEPEMPSRPMSKLHSTLEPALFSALCFGPSAPPKNIHRRISPNSVVNNRNKAATSSGIRPVHLQNSLSIAKQLINHHRLAMNSITPAFVPQSRDYGVAGQYSMKLRLGRSPK
jgi:hypothetical protein